MQGRPVSGESILAREKSGGTISDSGFERFRESLGFRNGCRDVMMLLFRIWNAAGEDWGENLLTSLPADGGVKTFELKLKRE